MNLLAFVTPLGWSRLLPACRSPARARRAKGFHYLGAGVLALVVLAVGLAVAARRGHRPRRGARIWPPLVVAAASVMALFALSPIVTFGSRVLVDLNGPWAAPLATFRSSGRFVWPLVYVLVIWAVVTVARRLPPRAACAVARPSPWSLQTGRSARRACHCAAAPRAIRRSTPGRSSSPADRWQAIAPHYRHVELVPAPQCGVPPIPYEPAVRLAAGYAADGERRGDRPA